MYWLIPETALLRELDIKSMRSFKKERVDTLLIDMDEELNQGLEPAFHCYVLEKS